MGMFRQSARRTVLIVLLSHDRRTILLHQPTSTAVWWPLRLDVPVDSSSARVVRGWRRQGTALSEVRRGRVTGYLTTAVSSAAGPITQDYRVTIFKLSEPVATDSALPSAHWWPLHSSSRSQLSLGNWAYS